MRSWKDYRFSDYILKKTSEKDPEFKEKMDYYKFGKEDFEDNVKDLHHVFYSKLQKEAETADEFFKGFVKIIEETTEFQDLKERTTNNQALAYIAVRDFVPKMYQEYLKAKESQKDKPEDQKDQAMKDYLKQNQDKIRQDTKQQIRHAIEEVKNGEKVQAFVVGCGDEASTNQTSEQAEKIIKYAHKLKNNEWFKKIVDMAGRYIKSANSKLAKDIPNIGCPIGVNIGKDLKNVLPQEFALMDMGGLFEDLFWLKWANGELLQYETKQKEPQQAGAFIACIDESGSMDYRIAEAKAFLFGMFLIAKSQNRAFHVIRFDHNAIEHEVKTLEDLIQIADSFMGGGTSFDAPLTKAVELIKTHDKWKKADVFFITDGYGHVSPEIIQAIEEFKKSIDFKILGLDLGHNPQSLKLFCDEVFTVREQKKFYDECFSS